jgi:hypothetical protein
MIVPTIHLNGTSADELLNQQRAVCDAACELLNILNAAAPNGRDYYPQGDDAIRAAMDAHNARMASVRKILSEAQEAALAILETQP